MAKRINRQLINNLSKTWEPKMRKAFRDSVDNVTSNAVLKDIIEALKIGDFERATRAGGLDTRDFHSMIRTLEGAFEEGGIATASAVQRAAPSGLNLIVRFNVRNPRAEQWLAQRSLTLITDIVDDQRIMIREFLRAGMQAGNNPRTVALDLVGRINRITGKREGGVIGLNSRMEQAARRYAEDIASGDPKRMARATRLALRDKRFDRSVAKAIREGTSLPKSLTNRMARQYRNKALKARGDTIARTEMLEALSAANREAYLQAVEDGTLQVETIKRFAVTAGDERVRPEHNAIPGMNDKGVGLNQPFATPNGPRMNTPFDINCRCYVETRVDFLAGVT